MAKLLWISQSPFYAGDYKITKDGEGSGEYYEDDDGEVVFVEYKPYALIPLEVE